MGVVEAMQHLEQSRTIASLNGSHSEERLGRLPIENGDSSSRTKSPPKYKRRITSAVRDFPPGCGRFDHLNSLRPDAASVATSESEPTECLVSQVDETVLMNGKAVGTVGTVESLTALEHDISDLLKNPHQVGVTTPEEEMVPVLSDRNFCSPPDGSVSVSNGNGLEKTAAKNYPLRRKALAVRDFPPLCGRNASLEARNFDQEKSGMDDKPSSSNTLETTVKQTGEDVQNEVFHKSELGENISEVIGDKVQPKGKEHAVQEMERQDECKIYSDMKVVSKDTRKKCIESPQESNGCQGMGFVRHSEKSGMDDKPSSSNTLETTVKQTGEDVQDEVFHKSELGGNISEVIGDKVQPKGKEHAVQEMERQDECKIYSDMKVVSKDTRKKCIEPPQESNGCQGMGVVRHSEEKVGKEIVVYHEKKSPKEKSLDISYYHNQLHEEDFESSELTSNRVIVLGVMAASDCPWKKGKGGYKRKLDGGMGEKKPKKLDLKRQLERSKTASRTKVDSNIGGKSLKKILPKSGKTAYKGTGQLLIRDKEYSLEHEEKEVLHAIPLSCCSDVCPPPFGHSSSSSRVHDNDTTVTRNKVRETLRLFQAVCRKLLQEEEGKSKEGGSRRRVDLAASKILKNKGKYVNTGKQILGVVPGVEVGDEFHYRIELGIIGLHRQIQGGIDYVKHGGKILATSIVASGGYADDLDHSNSLIYTGQGGNVMNTDKEPEDQKLKRGNLALKNSLHEKNPVRVIRGSESSDGKTKTYIYDGLYLVEKCWQDMGSHGKLVFKFQLDRIQGQPELAWKEVKKSKKFQVREGLCIDDISQGKESIPICAVNTIDDERPPSFIYITSMIYPDWCRPIPLKGCSCTVGCSDSEKCSCAVKNGGEIPYNFNGSIVEAKPLVYECGPSCKCPPSCHNRVSQHGIKFQLEIFKTKSRGWGVRSLNSISSGSFICEYIGELLAEKEAEERTGNDEYLFDIGNNYTDNSLWDGLSTLMPDAQSSSYEVVEDGFTIDAVQYGNVGRFINHSCSPNLYAQNVLYDHEDNRIPHIMFFAAENIPPLQELTYHYNYMIDQVRDSNGNIKKKSCYCGSPECTGRLY